MAVHPQEFSYGELFRKILVVLNKFTADNVIIFACWAYWASSITR